MGFNPNLSSSVSHLKSLINVSERFAYQGISGLDAIGQALKGLPENQQARLIEEIRLSDELYDNNDEFILHFITDPNSSEKGILLRGSDRGIGFDPELDYSEIFGPGLSVDEFYQKSVELVQGYIQSTKPPTVFLFGYNDAINPGNFFPAKNGILDIHIHGDIDLSDGVFKFYVSHSKTAYRNDPTGVWLGAEELADIIMSSPEFKAGNVNAIRLFACYGEQAGAEIIAKITGKPVLGANYLISVADNGDQSMTYGKLELFK